MTDKQDNEPNEPNYPTEEEFERVLKQSIEEIGPVLDALSDN